jgi:hypothetical protein
VQAGGHDTLMTAGGDADPTLSECTILWIGLC